MPLFTVASVSGSLGVTTLSVGLALTWPRPVVLVEADPSGGSAILAGYCTGVARPGLSGDQHRCGRLAQAPDGTEDFLHCWRFTNDLS